MHSTQLRREHIHGTLVGVAIGNAIGSSYAGLSPNGIHQLATQGLAYRLPRFLAYYGEDTRIMLLAAQALLNSRSQMDDFRAAFTRRLSFYALSLPPGIRKCHLISGMRGLGRSIGLKMATGDVSLGPATRAIFSTLAISGGGHRTLKWIEESTKLTHKAEVVITACSILALATEAAIHKPSQQLQVQDVLETLTAEKTFARVRTDLEQLGEDLHRGVLPTNARCNLAECPVIKMTLQCLYCWLAASDNFEDCLSNAMHLGGQAQTRGAIVGGLAGAHLGIDAVPEDLILRLQGWPHGPEWLEQLAHRFSHWPHGADDLHAAHAETSEPFLQLLRNLLLYPANVLRFIRKKYWDLRCRSMGSDTNPLATRQLSQRS